MTWQLLGEDDLERSQEFINHLQHLAVRGSFGTDSYPIFTTQSFEGTFVFTTEVEDRFL